MDRYNALLLSISNVQQDDALFKYRESENLLLSMGIGVLESA